MSATATGLGEVAIFLDEAPAGSEVAVAEILGTLPPPDNHTKAGAPLSPALAANAIPIYAISNEALASDPSEGLEDARRMGWRFLVLWRDEALVVDVPEGDAGVRVIRGGKVAERLARASVTGEKVADQADDYDARILDLHPMEAPVLWLRSRQERDQDRFVSLGAAARRLSGSRLLRKLRRKAVAQLSRSREPGGEAGG